MEPTSARRARPTRTGQGRRTVEPRVAESGQALTDRNGQARWYRSDLHIHTPASKDYQQAGVTAIDLLREAAGQQLDIVAFTDHNSIDGWATLLREIEDLELLERLGKLDPGHASLLQEYRKLTEQILVLPGFELTATFGFHILAIFPETTSIRLLHHLLFLLRVPEDRIGSGEVGATTDVLTAYRILHEHGAIVIGAHVNSTNGVAMRGVRFGGQTKIAYTQDEHLHALEVTDLDLGMSPRSTARFFNGTRAEYPRRMHCIQGSDAHRLTRDESRQGSTGIGDRVTEFRLPERSFAALKALFESSRWEDVRAARNAPSPGDDVLEARASGNTARQSFHETPFLKRVGQQPALQDMVAFANGDGGKVYLGIGPNDRRGAVGVTDPDGVARDLRRMAQAETAPVVPFTIEQVPVKGKPVVVVTVEPGREKPYVLAPGSILVRDHGESRVATREEIVALVQGAAIATPPVESPLPQPAAKGTRGGRKPAARESATTPAQAAQEPAREVAKPKRPASRRGGKGANGSVAGDGTPIPRTGVEIVEVRGDGENATYTMRDLRTGATTGDVTLNTPRGLWQYAIRQASGKAVQRGHVRWQGNRGFWKTRKSRSGEVQYNLVLMEDGRMRFFYGVSDQGLDDLWREVIPVNAARQDDQAQD